MRASSVRAIARIPQPPHLLPFDALRGGLGMTLDDFRKVVPDPGEPVGTGNSYPRTGWRRVACPKDQVALSGPAISVGATQTEFRRRAKCMHHETGQAHHCGHACTDDLPALPQSKPARCRTETSAGAHGRTRALRVREHIWLMTVQNVCDAFADLWPGGQLGSPQSWAPINCVLACGSSTARPNRTGPLSELVHRPKVLLLLRASCAQFPT